MLVSSEKQHMEVSLGSVEQALLKWLLRVSEPQFLHLCICVCVCVRERQRGVTQSRPTLCDLMGCSPPGSSVHRILQA